MINIRRVMCPDGRSFESSKFDYVILVGSQENREGLIKILHVAPAVRLGEHVKAGQNLGTLLRSGYFDFWTEPHIHIEVRPASDPIRARGGFKIERTMEVDEAMPAK